jgi:hypothetical protein
MLAAKEVNDKHQITTKVAAGTKAGVEKAKVVNEKYQVGFTLARALYRAAIDSSPVLRTAGH